MAEKKKEQKASRILEKGAGRGAHPDKELSNGKGQRRIYYQEGKRLYM